MHVTVTGATGLVGSRLVARLQERGDRVTVLSRDAEKAKQALGDVEAVAWTPGRGAAAGADPALIAALEGRDAVVNLAGEPVFQRWTATSKPRIKASRVETTNQLVAAIGATTDRPATLVNGSATGYYGDTGDAEVTEDAPPADDFLGDLASGWEAAARGAEAHGLRVAVVRTGLVLADDGGALPVMARPFRFGAGGWLGNGKQYVPWIHVDDEVGLLLAALDHPTFSGAVNAAAPEDATNKRFSKAVASALHRPALFPAPGFVLKTVLGEMSALVLDSSRAKPGRADELGYRFLHPGLVGALDDVFGS
ncbi:TIGR01777 family oxidoreductase [Patulibacter minatonensis]|uniref:TIGR01777 family oxidoreductase n=1 Tax=Patulibacter minatonensis TaxID=298163 RepID=UPI000479B424|nr:TIGR01777 family oxidoreductase [Patulibacter minatonensis]